MGLGGDFSKLCFCIVIAISDLVPNVETRHGLCQLLTASAKLF